MRKSITKYWVRWRDEGDVLPTGNQTFTDPHEAARVYWQIRDGGCDNVQVLEMREIYPRRPKARP